MALGSAPRRSAPGIWVTRSGRKLTPDGAAYWERQFRTGHTDGNGHIGRPSVVFKPEALPKPRSLSEAVASGPQLKADTGGVKKPPFHVWTSARKGDKAAQRQIHDYITRTHQVAQGVAQEDAQIGAQFGGVEQDAARANKTISPVGEALVKGLSPVEAAKSAYNETRKGNLGMAALDAAAILPFGPGRLGKIAEEATAIRSVKNVGRAAAKAEATLGRKAVSQPLTMQQALAHVFSTAGEQAAFKQARSVAREKAQRLVEARQAYGIAGEGSAGHEAFKAALAGPYAKVPFNDLTHLTPEQVSELTRSAYDHPELTDFEALGLGEAIKRANQGLPPRDFEIALVNKAFGAGKAKEFARGRSVAEAIANVVNIPRAIMSSFDVSAPFRQGLMGFAMYPGQSAKALPGMFKSLISENRYQARELGLTKKAMYDQSVKAGVNYSHLGGDIFGREEQFPSQAAEKLVSPDYWVGKARHPLTASNKTGHSFVRASGRAYTDFLDNQRYNIYETLTKTAKKKGWESTAKLDTDIAKITNWATGRGNMTHQDLAVIANTFLFSPRLFKSRLDAIGLTDLVSLATGKQHGFYRGMHPYARRQALRGLVTLVATGTAVLYAASKLGGVQVELDPRSSDWGKIRIGNTRFDIWGGYQQEARTIAQLATQTTKSTSTGALTHLGSGHHLDPLVRLLQGKLSPPFSTAVTFKQGKDLTGKPFSLWNEAQTKLIPLTLQDIKDAWRSGMSPWGIAATFGVTSLGIGTQTYKPHVPKGGPSYSDPFSNIGPDPNYSDPFSSLSP